MVKRIILLFALWLLLGSCSSKVPNKKELPNGRLLELYLNYPGTQPDRHRKPEFDVRTAQLIDAAQKEVYWAMYGFSRQVIIDAVLRAVQRGLDVQLAGDFGTYSTGGNGYIRFEDLMRRYPNAKLIAGNSQSIQHNKFMVVDRRYVMTGTGNITDSEIDRNYNAWVIIESRELAEDFINDHQMMMSGRFGHAKERLDYNNVFDVGGVKVEAYFSPHEDAMSRFLQAVGEAKQSIHFAIFAFTHDQLGRLLIEKHKQFIQLNSQDGGSRQVRGIMDRSQLTHNQYIEIYRLAGACGNTYEFQTPGADKNPFTAGWIAPNASNTRCQYPIDFRIDGNENNNNIGDWQAGGGRLHSKTIVIDAGTPDAKLLLGSFNWSPNANNNNDENLIVIHSPALVARFMEFWEHIYKDAIPLNRDRRGFCRDRSVQPLRNGDCPGASYQRAIISEVNYAGSMRKLNNKYYAYDANEFIEIYNPHNEALDVSYWTLYFPVIENYTDPGVYHSGWPSWESLRKRGVIGFPGGTVIPPKGFLVAWQTDQRQDINADAYRFPSEDLFDPAVGDTSKKLVAYNPFNGLSNFFTLFDRRTSNTGRSGSYPDFTWPEFQNPGGRCRPAWIAEIDRFSGSGYFNPYHMHTGNEANYPHRTSLWVELRDSRGNLIDIAGGNRLVPAAPTAHSEVRYFKGGFHNLTNPTDDTTDTTRNSVGSAFPNIPTGGDVFPLANTSSSADETASINRVCDIASGERRYFVSMERSSSFGAGTDAASWQHSTRDTAAGFSEEKRAYIKEEYRDYTIATPGKINSRWSSLP